MSSGIKKVIIYHVKTKQVRQRKETEELVKRRREEVEKVRKEKEEA